VASNTDLFLVSPETLQIEVHNIYAPSLSDFTLPDVSSVNLNSTFYVNNDKVGIGTDSPQAALDVSGTVKLGSDGTVFDSIAVLSGQFSF